MCNFAYIYVYNEITREGGRCTHVFAEVCVRPPYTRGTLGSINIYMEGRVYTIINICTLLRELILQLVYLSSMIQRQTDPRLVKGPPHPFFPDD